MAIWHKEENDGRPLGVWFVDLLKQSGFIPRNPVALQGRELVANCGNYTFRLSNNHIRAIGEVTSAMELQLLKLGVIKKPDNPQNPGKLAFEVYSSLPNEITITVEHGVAAFRKVLNEQSIGQEALRALLNRGKTRVGSVA